MGNMEHQHQRTEKSPAIEIIPAGENLPGTRMISEKPKGLGDNISRLSYYIAVLSTAFLLLEGSRPDVPPHEYPST